MAAISTVSATPTTAGSTNPRITTFIDDDRKLAQRLLMDLLIFTLFLLPILICEYGIEPFHRGFFCNDETISYPYRGNTVTPLMLGLLVGLLPAVIIIIIELWRFYRRGQMSAVIFIFGWKIRTWLLACVQQLAFYAVGLVLTFDATEVAKYTIGRLRPHFMAVCQPRLRDGTTCADQINQHRYILDYVCEAQGFTAMEVIEARRSFPSGHSSLAFYAMIYVAIYLQYRWHRRGSNSPLMRHFVQFVAIMLAWFTALSRVTDNWHHWSDVLVGSLIGVIGAWLTARIVAKFQRKHHGSDVIFHSNSESNSTRHSANVQNLKVNLPRQDTTATLDEVISTPPPYIMDTTTNGYQHDQYCTKV